MPGGTDQTLRPFLWRATKLYPDREIVSRTHDGMNRYGYSEYDNRTAQLANALDEHGIESGERIGTLCWNHYRHLETYFAVPSMGAQLHTINPMLPDKDIRYIVENAGDELLFVDPSNAEKLAKVAEESAAFDDIEFVVMGEDEHDAIEATPYETFVNGHSKEYEWPDIDEEQPAGMCYTSGTTGRPKGVEYTHQMLWSHTMGTLTPQGTPVTDEDVIMPVVPMFHVNAWGRPFTATAVGAKQVYAGESPESADIARLIETENVTITSGVPTVWLDLIEYAESHDVDLSSLETVLTGGAAAPESMIRWFDERNVEVLQAWGMTESAPMGTVGHLKYHLKDADYETRLDYRSKQGIIAPGLEMKVVGDGGDEIAWGSAARSDGDIETQDVDVGDREFGELWVRGPWITTEYFERPDANAEDFEDGWLKTGDVVAVDEEGYIRIVDRATDVIKSGGEWISSVELENAIMAHEDVSEAAVIGVPHERWQERPIAFAVPAEGAVTDSLDDEIADQLRETYPKWWVPDAIEFVESIPKTATGKFSKKDLKAAYDDELPDDETSIGSPPGAK